MHNVIQIYVFVLNITPGDPQKHAGTVTIYSGTVTIHTDRCSSAFYHCSRDVAVPEHGCSCTPFTGVPGLFIAVLEHQVFQSFDNDCSSVIEALCQICFTLHSDVIEED